MGVAARISEIGTRAISTIRNGINPLTMRIALAGRIGFSIPVMAAAFGATACSGYTSDIDTGTPCTSTPDIDLKDVKMKTNSDMAMSIEATGRSSIVAEVIVKSDNDAQYEGADVTVTIGTNNQYKFVNGMLTLCESGQSCNPCDTGAVIDNCNPVHDETGKTYYGIVPMGYPLENGEGAKMFQEYQGSHWAVFTQAHDRTFGEKVYVMDYTDSQTGKQKKIYLGRRLYTDWGTGEAVERYRWYEVGDDLKCVGTVSKDGAGQTVCSSEDNVSVNGKPINDDNAEVYDKVNNKILLAPRNFLFATDQTGAYSSLDENKTPLPDDGLFGLQWTQPMKTDPSSNAMFFGRADNQGGFTPWGLLRNEKQEIKYEQEAQYVRNMNVTKIEVIDLRAGTAGDSEVVDLSAEPKPFVDISSPSAFKFTVPPRFHSLGNPDFKLRAYLSEPDGTPLSWNNNFDLVRGVNTVVKVDVFKKGGGCE